MSESQDVFGKILSGLGSVFEIVIPVAVVALFVLFGFLWREVQSKQDVIVVVNYERLTELYTAETVRRDAPEDENLGASTAMYLTAVQQVADDFAQRTGSMVIMAEAVVGTDEEVRDITDLVHLQSMERVRAYRRSGSFQ